MEKLMNGPATKITVVRKLSDHNSNTYTAINNVHIVISLQILLYFILNAKFNIIKVVLPCGICMIATVKPATISLVMFFFQSYFGNQTSAGKRDNMVFSG